MKTQNVTNENWRVSFHPSPVGHNKIETMDGDLVGSFDGENSAHRESRAHLAAAAPDLYRALQHAQSLIQAAGLDTRPGGAAAMSQYNAALLRAEGKTL